MNFDFLSSPKFALTPEQRRQHNLEARKIDTGRVHRDKGGKILCKIFRLLEKETRYTFDDLVKLRAQRGIGNVRKIKKEA